MQHSKGFTIQLCLITDDVNLGLDHLIKTVSTGFFHCKVTVFSFIVSWERYFEIIQISYFSSNFHPITSAYICGTCMQQSHMWGLANDNVLFLTFTLNPLTGTVHREELSLFLHLFIQLFTYICMDSYLTMGYNRILSLFYASNTGSSLGLGSSML